MTGTTEPGGWRARRIAAAAAVLAFGLAAQAAPPPPAHAPTGAGALVRVQAAAPARPRAYRRPLLHTRRAQFCLKALGLYEGPLDGRADRATLAGLRRVPAPAGIAWRQDVLHDGALHHALWQRCAGPWARAATEAEAARPRRAPHVLTSGPPVTVPGETPSAPPPAPPLPGPPQAVDPRSPPPRETCIAPELRDLAGRLGGRRIGAETCALPCLPRPAGLDADEIRSLERRHGIAWCRQCVEISTYLPPEDIRRLERAGGITICSTPPSRLAPPATQIMHESAAGLRALLGKGDATPRLHDDIAVVISLSRYGGRLPARPTAVRDAALMQIVLVERLGYGPENVIELASPDRQALERLFGLGEGTTGELAARLKARPGAGLLVYVSGLGAIDGSDAYLLPADAVKGREAETAVPLEKVYRSLARLGGRGATVVLEVDFNSDSAGPVVPPNLPETRSGPLPRLGLRGLRVMTAAERDQRALVDPLARVGLFTRHLAEALAGAADEDGIGNRDGAVDTLEAFVLAAQRTMWAARRAHGVLQRPQTTPTPPVVLGRPPRADR